VSGLRMSVELPATPRAPGFVRRLLTDAFELWGWGSRDDREDAVFLASEVVSNAVEHAGGMPHLLLEVVHSDGWVRVSVADGSSLRPIVRELEHHQPGGLGMRLVEGLSDQWGVEDHQSGKKVWFEKSAGSSSHVS
jgi:anti-sigma regulatory factor (Ser/Thr protein kinase)